MAKRQTSFFDDIAEKYAQFWKSEDTSDVLGIPTGSISLDYCIGVGGIPRGRFTEIYGTESSGKTTLSLSISNNVVNNGGKVLYIDAENGLDWKYIKDIAPNASDENFILLQPSIAEEVFDLAEKGLRSKEFDLIVVDSVAVLATAREMEGDVAGANVAELSRVLARFIKRNAFEMRKSDTAFIFINQVRDKIGARIPMIESPGGHSVKHICSVRIQLSGGQSKSDRIFDNTGNPIGVKVTYNIKKNKVGKPYFSGEYDLYFARGIDSLGDLVKFAETIGVLRRQGAWYWFGDIRLGNGLANTIGFLNENPDTLDNIKGCVYDRMKLDMQTFVLPEEPVVEEVEDVG